MSDLNPSLTLGIEEEYLLVDPVTRDLAVDPPQELFDSCQACLGDHVTTEFLRSQIEIGTPVCRNIGEARGELKRLRREVSRVANEFGLNIIAASTHPFANWEAQKHTPRERYDALARDMGGAIRRMLICGMHVHAGIENADLRIDLMNQVSYFLPHLLGLSTSSPFWQGQDMGLMSSRLTVFDGMPRTGIPDRFESYADYERLLERMIAAGGLEDASKIWWDVRPSSRYPTLEMRITDVCTRVDDALTVAAIYQSLLQPGDDLLSHGETPHYHRRCVVSLLSSGWGQVVPTLYGRQANWLVGGRGVPRHAGRSPNRPTNRSVVQAEITLDLITTSVSSIPSWPYGPVEMTWIIWSSLTGN
jgi:carboxylate-amine ligase